MASTLTETNGHIAPQVDLTSTSPTTTGTGEVDKDLKPKPVMFSPAAKAKFKAAAKRAGLSQLEAAELAAELLDRVSRDEKPETQAERRARLASKVGGKS